MERLLRRFGPGLWNDWPERAYRQERYQQRLELIQGCLAEQLDRAPAGRLRLISLCAGDGRDVIDVLRWHSRRDDVTAWCVELDPGSVALGVRRAAHAGLGRRVRFINDDATVFETYQDLGPADLVLVCGVWGHVPPDDRASLVGALQTLCRPGGRVLWSRGVSRGMQRLHAIESLFSAPSWEHEDVRFTPSERWAVTVHRYNGPPLERPMAGRIFHFCAAAGG